MSHVLAKHMIFFFDSVALGCQTGGNMNISKELTTLQCKGGRTKIAEDGVQITGSVSNLIDFTHVLGAKELITKLRDGVEAIIRFGMDDSSGDYYEFKGILSSADLQAPDSGGFAGTYNFEDVDGMLYINTPVPV